MSGHGYLTIECEQTREAEVRLRSAIEYLRRLFS